MKSHLSDIEIAQRTELKPITEIARKLNINDEEIECFGCTKAKISLKIFERLKEKPDGQVILVTSINPTPAGEGKSTVTVGLSQALWQIGKKSIVAMREPSLGPTMGLKGGAAGGGYSQVLPMEDINLHFTGDMHAITAANNALAAFIDNHIHQGNELNIDIRKIVWKRALDLNDRALRETVVGLGGKANGFPREDGFDITVASEIMAVLCLARDLADLKKRLASMIVATVRALKMHGGTPLADLKQKDLEALKRGIANLAKHIETIDAFGLPYVVAVNRFVQDTEDELEAVLGWCRDNGHPAALCNVWEEGGKGGTDLAREVIHVMEQKDNRFSYLYELTDSIEDKLAKISRTVYGAEGVEFTEKAKKQLLELKKNGLDGLPVCVAKTQYSLSDDPGKIGRPQDFSITVRELKPSRGAGFIVALTGSILTMPGLPKHPAALKMDVDESGRAKGLF
ncbi:formate--tetrahydrofolate ligase [Bacillus licheniformis]|uniref:formate--tetrahydrofolate ligase n=1 Tax=Bacillus licheniformis TaxID=1402 RepID=UPI00054FCCA4|nr:formate--tetrahydrofolate ligase [Bacillus licheniformis]